MINNPKVKGSALWNTCKNLKIVFGININMCIYQICAFSFTFPFPFRLPLWGHFLPLFFVKNINTESLIYILIYLDLLLFVILFFSEEAPTWDFSYLCMHRKALWVCFLISQLFRHGGFRKKKQKTNDLSNYLSCCTTHESDRSFRGAHCQNILISIRPKTSG